MARQFRLFWSNIENYEECPQKFLWSRGFGTIDLGGGPGRPKPVKDKKSEHHAVMGSVISFAIERLYNDELWKDPANLVGRLMTIIEREFAVELGKRTIKWSPTPSKPKWDESPPRGELLETCKEGVLGYLRTMKKNKLLGSYARSEVDLSTYVNKYTPIGGRPDIVIRREDTGVMILDGKNSSHVGKYTNPDQLKWYALCFYLAYHTMPSRLAFVYFRYPDGKPPEPEEGKAPTPPEEWNGLVEIPFDKQDLKVMAHRAVETYRVISKEMFDPTPSSKACKFCDYQNVCPVRIEQKLNNTRKPKDAVEEALAQSSGFVDVSALFSGLNKDQKP